MSKHRSSVRSAAATARSAIFVSAFRFTLRTRGRGQVMREFATWSHRVGTVEVLRALGARIGQRSVFEPGLRIQNALNGDCSGLTVGDDVYVGPEVLLDLKGNISIESTSAIAGRVAIVTHLDVGASPLRYVIPPTSGDVLIRTGTFLGFGCTVLQGAVIGPESVVGAGSVVIDVVPPRTVVAGVPARAIRSLPEPTQTS